MSACLKYLNYCLKMKMISMVDIVFFNKYICPILCYLGCIYEEKEEKEKPTDVTMLGGELCVRIN